MDTKIVFIHRRPDLGQRLFATAHPTALVGTPAEQAAAHNAMIAVGWSTIELPEGPPVGYAIDGGGQMVLAFDPQIVSATPQVFNAASTDVSVVLPSTGASDRLILFLNRSFANTDPIATPSGWTALVTSGLTGSASNFCRAYYRDGAAGTTADFAGGTSTLSTSLVVKLSGCDLTVAPVANGVAQGSNTTTVDPAALTGPNAGVSQRNLWITYVGTGAQDTANGATPAVTGFPAGYSDTGTSTTNDVTPPNGCGQGWGLKASIAGSDDPSAWTYCPTGTGRAFAITVAVRGVIG